MLHELRTTMRGGGGRELARLFGDGAVGGAFQTDVGDAGRTIVLRPYAGPDSLTPASGTNRRSGSGPTEVFGRHELELLEPAPFMRPLEPTQLGSIWELCWFDYTADTIDLALDEFGKALPHREEYYPVVGCWKEVIGPNRDRLYLLYPFKDLAHRDEIIDSLRQDPAWPPYAQVQPRSGGSKLIAPTNYSPLR